MTKERIISFGLIIGRDDKVASSRRDVVLTSRV